MISWKVPPYINIRKENHFWHCFEFMQGLQEHGWGSWSWYKSEKCNDYWKSVSKKLKRKPVLKALYKSAKFAFEEKVMYRVKLFYRWKKFNIDGPVGFSYCIYDLRKEDRNYIKNWKEIKLWSWQAYGSCIQNGR